MLEGLLGLRYQTPPSETLTYRVPKSATFIPASGPGLGPEKKQ